MSYRKKQPSACVWKNPLQLIGNSILLAVFLQGCSSANSSPTDATQPNTSLPTNSSESTATPATNIMWTKTESPLFPANWPPTSETVWVRYTFAYGKNPATLFDGSYVTRPLSKTEWKAGNSSTTTLSTDMSQAAIQGVKPLDNETAAILKTGKQVSEYCLKMTELPKPNAPKTKEMLDYYQAWFKYNCAFLGLIRDNHAGFIDWVTNNQ
ncbi:MAG: hypothetical protein PHE17_09080 [Thiothrix sp.]|uniref:hypothetical protein n=1 Tax=Thiothrix sp. TaxID=1032 RepID=UPI002607261A|nr:hypothetical protein [Thiothrix sp.]MDD5393157.1 hypothetical protein [Thiothrix sp.]